MERFRPTSNSVSQTGGHTINPVNPNVSRPDLPASYQGLLDANPYMNLDYRESGWQKFLSSLGFRTGYDKRMEDMQLQAQEYNAQVANMAFQNEFNSPEAQASRMRAAGQNPDLLGTGDVSGSAGMSEDTNPPAPTETDSQSVGQFANVIMSAFSMATGFAKDLGTLRSLRLANDNQEIANVAGIVNGAQNFLTQHLPADVPKSDSDWASNFMDISNILESSYKPNMSKRSYRRFSNEVSGLWNSLPREDAAYKMYLSKIRNKQEAHILDQSQFYSDQEEVLREIVGPLVDLNDRYLSAQSKADTLAAENLARTEKSASDLNLPEGRSEAESASVRGDIQEFNMQRELRSTLAKIIHKLETHANSGKRGAGFADTMLLTLSIMSMLSAQSTSSSVIGPDGRTDSKSRSIGF